MTTSLYSDDENLFVQVAAGLGSDGVDARVLGVASISSQCDLYHKTAPEKGSTEWKALMPSNGGMMANACAPDAGCWGGVVRNLFLKQVLGSMCYSERKDQDFGFKQMYLESQRKGDGGCERTWEAMDKDPFFVSKNLYSVLHGCNDKTTPLGDIWRLFGKWDYDCADFKGPCFIYNGDPETTPATMAEQIHRSIPQVKMILDMFIQRALRTLRKWALSMLFTNGQILFILRIDQPTQLGTCLDSDMTV